MGRLLHFIELGRVVLAIIYRVPKFTDLFVSLRHIGEVIQPPEKCLILTDSLSSVKALLSRKILHRTHPQVEVEKCGSRLT
jgi:hypothetical protein